MTEHKNYTINDLIKQIDILPEYRPPTLDYFKGMDTYFEDMRNALIVVEEYKTRDANWDPTKMVEDALYLAAIHTTMSEMVGYLQSNSTRADDIKKFARSKYIMSLKEKRDKVYTETGQFLKSTEKEYDDVSRILSKNLTDSARDAEAVSRMITNAWYAIGDFCRILQTAINRANKEQSLG